ncbi:MAG: DUF2239 family protein [Bacteriovoracia bacterium]
MENQLPQLYTAFDGHRRLAEGPLEAVVLSVRRHLKAHASASVLVFSDLTGKQMDFDLQGTEKETLQRLQVYLTKEAPPAAASGPGRPRLGVVSREISLLPRHWEWLSAQPGGASATLRRLVEDAKRHSHGREALRNAQERTYKFMAAIAGDLPGYEEALRALYAKDRKKFRAQIAEWPLDVREYAKRLSGLVFE